MVDLAMTQSMKLKKCRSWWGVSIYIYIHIHYWYTIIIWYWLLDYCRLFKYSIYRLYLFILVMIHDSLIYLLDYFSSTKVYKRGEDSWSWHSLPLPLVEWQQLDSSRKGFFMGSICPFAWLICAREWLLPNSSQNDVLKAEGALPLSVDIRYSSLVTCS